MDQHDNRRLQLLLNLVNPLVGSKKRAKMLDQIETIGGYDLALVLAFISRNKYSGNLIIVNEHDELSGISFIYGDIVKIDYPDKENMLGNVIVEADAMSKFEMQEVLESSKGMRLGDYLLSKKLLTPEQLKKILYRQTKQRLTKYLSSLSVRINFTFDGESSDTILISKENYLDLLQEWLFKNFQDDWLSEYVEFYSQYDFESHLLSEHRTLLGERAELKSLVNAVVVTSPKKFTYDQLFKASRLDKKVFHRALHFLVLNGALVVMSEALVAAVAKQAANAYKKQLDVDLAQAKKYILEKQYFLAIGVVNKYTKLGNSDPRVLLYVIWIKLIGAFYNSHSLDLAKMERDFTALDAFKTDPAEYYYVKSILEALQARYRESDDSYMKAVSYDPVYKGHPVDAELGFMTRIKKFFKTLKIKT